MSTINNIGAGGNLGPTDPVGRIGNNSAYRSAASDPSAAPSAKTGDRLELSGVSQVFQTLQANNIRADKVASVRDQIAAGTYETDDKLNATADKLLDELTK